MSHNQNDIYYETQKELADEKKVVLTEKKLQKFYAYYRKGTIWNGDTPLTYEEYKTARLAED